MLVMAFGHLDRIVLRNAVCVDEACVNGTDVSIGNESVVALPPEALLLRGNRRVKGARRRRV